MLASISLPTYTAQPGAFSAYRYIALQNDKYGFGPLASYFKGEVLHGRDTDIFTSNMCKLRSSVCMSTPLSDNCLSRRSC